MKRRELLTSSTVGVTMLLAGCSDLFQGENGNSTETPNQNISDPESTPIPSEDIPEAVPKDFPGIAKFGHNKHQENAKNNPFKLTVETSRGETDSDTFTFVSNGEGKSLLTLERTDGETESTVEQYSSSGFIYSRTNPSEGDITYSKTSVEDKKEVYIYSGLNMIDQLNTSGVEVSGPRPQDGEKVYRYYFTKHRQYDTVSGFVEIDVSKGIITEVQFSGVSKDSEYSLQMDFTFGSQTVERPAWVQRTE